MTKRAFQLRRLFTFFCHVLPVIEFDWLARRFRLAGSAQ
jgi:hypothetical protein